MRNTSNRLGGITVSAGGSRAFTYDAAGNVTLDNRTGGGYGYTYNSAGRLSEFRVNGVLQASYKYDALGRQAIRTLTSPTSVTIHSVFDSQGRRIAEYNEATGALIREYVWNGWEAIAVIEGGVISYVRTDHIGRPVFATNATGAVVWTASYLPFGGVRTATGAPIEARFPGQWFQSESGLYQNWMRDYDPTTGRYIEADPLGLVDAASIYGYAGQNPVMNMDPRGECFGPAAPLFWYCVGAAIMIYDYVVDDCYTLDDFLASLYRATTIVLNPCRKLGPLCAMAGNGGGGKGWGGGSNGNKYSSEKEALVEMAKGDKRTGITEGDMQAYKELNRELPDPFPENMVRGPEAHDSGLPTSTEPHGHVGPVGHIPIRPKQ